MASYGSAYISLSKDQSINIMNEVFNAIRKEGAIAGVHCCGNTDWSILLSSDVDILNFDAFSFMENMSLYPMELRAFLDREAKICWGLIPNDERITNECSRSLADRLQTGFKLLSEKAHFHGVNITTEELALSSLLSPACGLGSTTIPISEKAFELLVETSMILKKG